MIYQDGFAVPTPGRATIDITALVAGHVEASRVVTGICTVFLQHTSASLMLCENADPDVRHDLESFMARLVPDGSSHFRHVAEGPDDMPAHVRSVLTASSLVIPVSDGGLALGLWQGIYLWEHRSAPHQRRVLITVMG